MSLQRFELPFKAGRARKDLSVLGNVYDPLSLTKYFKDDRLERWLRAWDYPKEADCISKIDKKQEDDSLCHELEVILKFTDQQIEQAAERGRKIQQAASQKLEADSSKISVENLDDLSENKGKAEKKAQKFLKDLLDEFKMVWNLLEDYRTGRYRNISWKAIASLAAAVIYLLSPFDAIPDFLPFIGGVDDALMFGLVLASFKMEIDAYKQWKSGKTNEENQENQSGLLPDVK